MTPYSVLVVVVSASRFLVLPAQNKTPDQTLWPATAKVRSKGKVETEARVGGGMMDGKVRRIRGLDLLRGLDRLF